jgi:hypothetical protein
VQTGLAVDNGVLVDAALRTDAPDVYAVGVDRHRLGDPAVPVADLTPYPR